MSRKYRFLCIILACIAAAGFTFLLAGARGAGTGLPRLETRILGQSQLLSGCKSSIRIITIDHTTGKPVKGASIKAQLRASLGSRKDAKLGAPVILFTGKTNKDGTLESSFTTPEVDEGNYELTITASGLGETDVITNTLRIYRDQQIMLSADKPIYQPGQVIHIRSLTLKRPDLTAVSGVPLTLEVEDAKANKVFKKTIKTSAFGIASVDFQLADEINMGRYTIRAIVGKTKTEKKLTVDRYVLPKFKIKFTPDKPFYMANETVEGKVQVDYFFGKPVVNGKVSIKAATFDFQFKDFAEITGQTDASGNFKFSQQLPSYFVGQPLEQGNAFVKFDVSITDGANHEEKMSQTVPVAAQRVKIIAVPEGGRIIPNMENTIYVMTTSPDGSPLAQTVLVKPAGLPDITIKTDASGIGEFKVTPKNANLDLTLSASKNSTEQPSVTVVSLQGQPQEDSVMLHTDKALAKVGDTLNLTILSPSASGAVYIDVIKAGQTLNTQSVDIVKGRGDLSLPLTADMDGSIEINAYRISRSGQIVRDTRLVYVDPANDLKVGITPDKDSYLPGKPAKISFDVRNSKGKGIAAALGVSIVDESVFALQDMQPGMEKVYFLLEKELMEPKFEVHGITPSDIVRPMDTPDVFTKRDKSARVLFALAQQNREQSGGITSYSLADNSYTEKLIKIRNELGKRVKADYVRIAKAVNAYYAKYPNLSLKEQGGIHHLAQVGLLGKADLLDQWGREYAFVPCGCGNFQHSLSIISLGPDGQKDNEDDIGVGGAPSNPDDVNFMNNGRQTDLAFGGKPRAGGGMAGFGGGVRMLGKADMIGREAAAAMPGMPGGMMAEDRFEGKADMMGEASLVMRDDKDSPAKEDVRVRQYFPETMYFNPAVISDDNGKATVSLDVADSITTWRISAMASSKGGQLGSASQGMKVFQDFFIDIDLPVSLTQNDEVSMPVAVYNYLPSAQTVTLELTKEPWFELVDDATKKVEIGENDVKGAYFRIKVKEIGTHKLTIHAMGSKMSDAISRSIDVMPDGRETLTSINDRLEKTVEKTMEIPEAAINGASNILVKVYPGIFSQVVEGMDKILQMPNGCFEQTSSTTYPNILVLDYMKTTNQITPEIRMKAEQYINLGYQRLVTFEVPGGGFSWFGDAPANKVLTAYGVMEFADMSKVYEVDPNLITRTQQWLIAQREKDGSWSPDKNYLHEDSWGKIQKSNLLPTAWITWSLLHSGVSAGDLQTSLAYLKKNANDAKDAYTLALLCNALIAAKGQAGKTDLDSDTRSALERLVDMKVEEDGKVYWKSGVSTVTFTRGASADVETTALASIALIESGRYADVVGKALTFIIQSKDASGTWGSTQATILSLKALLMSLQNRTQDVNAKVTVIVNGREAGTFQITPENSDVMRQIDCKQFVKEGKNTIRIEFDGKGSSLYQITGKYYMPWDRPDVAPGEKLISISVDFDRTQLEKDDILTSTVRIAYNRPGTADMVMVDLGTPPGFQALAEDLESMLDKKVIQRYTITGRQVILYFDKIENGKPVEFKYRLKAKFPIKARTPKSTAYMYYNPEINDVAVPVDIQVK